MAKAEWGSKHRCTSCGAKFYDFNKTPLICPKCGAANQPEVLLKPKRTPVENKQAKAAAAAAAAAAAPPEAASKAKDEAAAVADEPDDADDLPDEDDDVSVDDDDDDKATLNDALGADAASDADDSNEKSA